MRWPGCCTTRACCANPTPANRGSVSAHTTHPVLADTSRHFEGRGRRHAQGRRHAGRTCRGAGPVSLDAIIVGAGTTACAGCYLARAGLKVKVLDATRSSRALPVSRKLYQTSPTRTAPTCAVYCVRKSCARLELPRFGLQIIPYEGGCTMSRGGGHLAVYDNHRCACAGRSHGTRTPTPKPMIDIRGRSCANASSSSRCLMREPPDPTSFKAARHPGAAVLGQTLSWIGRGAM